MVGTNTCAKGDFRKGSLDSDSLDRAKLATAGIIQHGVGLDLVYVPDFLDQLNQSGSRFPGVFTSREWAYAHSQATSAQVTHSLAARWAAKEAAVKAWSCLLLGEPPVIEEAKLEWSQIEVAHDLWERPLLRFHGQVHRELQELDARRGRLDWTLSLSHDGDYAAAYVFVSISKRCQLGKDF